MAHLEQWIADLMTATDQMKQAALGGDWELVERLQKRRAALVAQIQETAGRDSLTVENIARLRAARKQEATVLALAAAQRQTLSEALANTKKGTRAASGTRMQRTYRETQRQG